MTDEIRDLVTDVTENVVEQPTEEAVEQPKMYTEEEFNTRMDELLAKKIGRREAKIRREYEQKYAKYKEAEEVLNAGLGTSDISEATSNLREFYEKKGVKIPTHTEPAYSQDDMKILADHEARKIIELGSEDVDEELERLADIGLDNMTPKEQLVFNQLGNYRKAELDRQELAKIGVSEKALQDEEFIEFSKALNPKMSVKDQYELFTKYRPEKKIEMMGSMKNTTMNDTGVKDFYTVEEAKKFTKEDYEKIPGLFEAVEKSSYRWKR